MLSNLVRAAAVFAAVGAVTAVLVGPAGADTVIPLRDSTRTSKIGSGGSITITVKAQRAKLSPGMVSLPTTRNAWVSGNIAVKVGGDADGGSIEAGYVVGCQVDVGSAAVTAGVGASTTDGDGNSFPGGTPAGVSVTGSTGGTLSLAAGSIGTQALTYDRATWPKPGDEVAPDWYAPSNSFDFKGSSGGFSYADQTIGVDGCAGYAQARLYVIVEAQVGNSEGRTILWGDRFTLG